LPGGNAGKGSETISVEDAVAAAQSRDRASDPTVVEEALR
jgi:hypothetical protein